MHWWKTTMQVLAVMASLLVILILATIWMRLLCPAFTSEPVLVKVELPETEEEATSVDNANEADSQESEDSSKPHSKNPWTNSPGKPYAPVTSDDVFGSDN